MHVRAPADSRVGCGGRSTLDCWGPALREARPGLKQAWHRMYASFHGYSRDLAFPLTKSNWALSVGTLGCVNVAGV